MSDLDSKNEKENIQKIIHAVTSIVYIIYFLLMAPVICWSTAYPGSGVNLIILLAFWSIVAILISKSLLKNGETFIGFAFLFSPIGLWLLLVAVRVL